VPTNSLNQSNRTFIPWIKGTQFEEEDPFEIKLDTLSLGFNLMVRPEDFDAGNFVALGGIGSYQRHLWGKKADGTPEKFRGIFGVNLKIQSPSTGKDTTATLNRIYSSGSVGNINGVFKIGYIAIDNYDGIALSISPNFNWQDSKVLLDTTSNNFAYFSFKSSLSIWSGPILLNGTVEYYKVLRGDSDNIISSKLNESLSICINVGINIGNGLYAQGRYVIPTKTTESSMELFEFALTKTLDFK